MVLSTYEQNGKKHLSTIYEMVDEKRSQIVFRKPFNRENIT